MWCCTLRLLCRVTSKDTFSVWSDAEVKFGSKGSWIDLHTDNGLQRLLVRVTGPAPGSSLKQMTQPRTPKWRQLSKRLAERRSPTRHQQHRRHQQRRGWRRLKDCGSNEMPAILQHPGRALGSWDNHSAKADSRVAAMLTTYETG